ncbi:MAG: hypothetical protein GWO81_02375 [Verrucomicrobia bacterium]|nr:hypothetical protein [Verrucomicrobiota bacterium]
MNHKLLLIPSLALGFLLPFTALTLSAEVTPEMRVEAVSAKLTDQPQLIALYSGGFVCKSCGIGARIHLSKVEGVDASVFDRGIEMDAAKQLLYIAFKPGIEPDLVAVHRAIDKAGYEADLYYRWTESGMVMAPLPPLK